MNSDNPEIARISSTGGSGLLIAAPAPATAEISESALVPAPIARLGDDACHAWVEFFASRIRNPNTRASYTRAAHALFRWLGDRGIEDVRDIRGVHFLEKNDEWAVSRRFMTLGSIVPACETRPCQAARRGSPNVPALTAGYRDGRQDTTAPAGTRSAGGER